MSRQVGSNKERENMSRVARTSNKIGTVANRGVWPTVRRCGRWALAAGLAAVGAGTALASPATFTFNSPNVGWVPMLLGGSPLSDPQGDSPGPRDIVGDADNPMLYVAADATHVFFRLRLNSDPTQSATNLRPFGWGCFINTDADPTTYEFSTIVDGVNNPDQISFFKNTTTLSVNDPTDEPDLPPVSVVLNPLGASVGHAQVSLAGSSFNGDADYFIDWAIERDSALAAGFDTEAPAQYYCGSSNNGSTIAADCSGSALSDCPLDSQFTDPVSCGDDGCGICGDGAQEGTEGCDDGNLTPGDGCNSQCLLELLEPCPDDVSCASGFCDPADSTCACDQNADCAAGQLCNTTSAPNSCVDPGCGNGILEAGEGCDDSNTVPSDGCNGDCLLELGEPCLLSAACASAFCDPSSDTCACDEDDDCPSTDLCNTQVSPNACVPPGCGNGIIETDEGCDDGNTLPDDGCNGSCLLELGQPCVDSNECASEFCNPSTNLCACDDADDCSVSQLCNSNLCVAAGCGNGVLEPGEGCDDNNTEPDDGCNSQCLLELGESCGANSQCASAFCDPTGNICACDQAVDCSSGQLCDTISSPNQCVPPGCGNNVLESGEGCDDGNTDPADGCNGSCLLEIGEPCDIDGVCASGLCDSANSRCACDEDVDCPVGGDLCDTISDPNLCVPPGCGNNVLEAGEGCDDGNVDPSDGCDAACLLELGEPCTDGAECASSTCDPTAAICVCDEDADCSGGQLCYTVPDPSVCVAPGCGNGIVESGEGCDDANFVTGDGCNSQCLVELGQPCGESLDCASGFCDTTDNTCACDEDDDCAGGQVCDTAEAPNACVAPGCGNNVLETGEACDDGGIEPGDGCDSNCLLELGEDCLGNDECASELCDPDNDICTCNQDSDCPDPRLCDTVSDPNVCVLPGCGNNVLEAGEACDDGNQALGDGCDDACLIELGEECSDDAECGSGLCDTTDNTCACDDDADCPNGQLCDAAQAPNLCVTAGCGNNIVEASEGCDDGNIVPGDGCDETCLLELAEPCTDDADCASGFCDPADNACACDESADCATGQACNVAVDPNTCVAAGCGNGVLEAGEACDDTNLAAGDGCDAACQRELGEPCDDGIECASGMCDTAEDMCVCDASDDCSNGDVCDTNADPNACVAPGCGNGVVESGEACDDGNTDAGDGCSQECLQELGEPCEEGVECGSGMCDSTEDICVCDASEDCEASEVCDTSAMPNACVPAGCGNGVLESGEACDDGNDSAGDGCDAECLLELDEPCSADGECESGFCDSEPGMCSCDEDSDCQGGEYCGDGAERVVCIAFGCGDGRIDGSEACDDDNTESGDGCSSSCQVEDGYECEGAPSACRMIPCSEHSDCDSGQVCRQDSGECVEGECVESGDCAEGERCDPEELRCAECFSDDHCGTGMRCNEATNVCESAEEVYASGNGILCSVTMPGGSRSTPLAGALLLLGVGLGWRRRRQRTVATRRHCAGERT